MTLYLDYIVEDSYERSLYLMLVFESYDFIKKFILVAIKNKEAE